MQVQLERNQIVTQCFEDIGKGMIVKWELLKIVVTEHIFNSTSIPQFIIAEINIPFTY